MKFGGISSTWCETSTVAGDDCALASSDSVETRSSRPPRSRPAAGSSSSSSSGSVISARAICTRLRSPSLSVPKVRSASRCRADLGEQLVGALVVEVVVRLAPPADDAVAAETTTSSTFSSAGSAPRARRCHADPGPQLEDVDRAEHLAEDPRDAVGRVDHPRPRPAATWSCPHRWGRGPPSGRARRPARRCCRSAWPSPPHRHVGELEDGGHGATLAKTGRAGVSSPPVTAPCPFRSRRGWPGGAPPGCAAPWWPTSPSTRSSATTRPIGHRSAGRRRARRTGHGARAGSAPRAPSTLGLAWPAEGDPAGLGGPAELNAAAFDAGEAVIAGPHGRVPRREGAVVFWHAYAARPGS